VCKKSIPKRDGCGLCVLEPVEVAAVDALSEMLYTHVPAAAPATPKGASNTRLAVFASAFPVLIILLVCGQAQMLRIAATAIGAPVVNL
jgi:hypothetical protein